MKKKVLVVDDEEIIRKSLRIHLGRWGHEVTEAADGEQGILRLGKEAFDLVICDVMMPNKDGWQFLKELRARQNQGDTPVIILTAKNKDSDMFKGYDLGATYFMTKPFTRGQLQYGLELIFGKKEGPADAADLTQLYNEEDKEEKKDELTTSEPPG